MSDYPRWVFHASEPSRIVRSLEEREGLGPEWHHHPVSDHEATHPHDPLRVMRSGPDQGEDQISKTEHPHAHQAFHAIPKPTRGPRKINRSRPKDEK